MLSRIWENLLVESWALESGIQLKESGIPLTIGIRNPSSKFQCLESGIHAMRNPESKPVLDSLPCQGDTIMNALLVETERNAGCGYLWQNIHGRDGNLNKQRIWGKKKHTIYTEKHSKLSASQGEWHSKLPWEPWVRLPRQGVMDTRIKEFGF